MFEMSANSLLVLSEHGNESFSALPVVSRSGKPRRDQCGEEERATRRRVNSIPARNRPFGTQPTPSHQGRVRRIPLQSAEAIPRSLSRFLRPCFKPNLWLSLRKDAQPAIGSTAEQEGGGGHRYPRHFGPFRRRRRLEGGAGCRIQINRAKTIR